MSGINTDLMELILRIEPKAHNHIVRTGTAPQACGFRTLAALAVVVTGVCIAAPAAAEEAHKFGPDALNSYCDGQKRYLAIIKESDEKFGVTGTDESVEWIRARQAENNAQIEKDLGAPYLEWAPVAASEWWNQRCEALWRGWLMIEEKDAMASTSDDARKVEEALALLYIKMTNRGEFKNFDGRPYKGATCKSDVIDGFRLTGCTMFGGGFFDGFFSDPMIFMVANKDGHPAFVPLETNTKEDIQSSYYSDVNGNPVMTGWYVGSYPLPFDWPKAVKRFAR
ncbi:hypothetical protein [Devosia sp.]|uniref:hypothetical protein n=1 Tax=Devosia sp. TaxID=1871048 RepID=UPI003BAD4381